MTLTLYAAIVLMASSSSSVTWTHYYHTEPSLGQMQRQRAAGETGPDHQYIRVMSAPSAGWPASCPAAGTQARASIGGVP